MELSVNRPPLPSTLPASFAREGFLTADAARGLNGPRRLRRLLIGTEGAANTGKTEFALSGPGPGLGVCLDRGIDATLDNPTPPPTRTPNWAYKIITVPLQTQVLQDDFKKYWHDFYAEYMKALRNVDARTVLLDGDSDSWELQQLAEWGRVTQVPPLQRTACNAARRAMVARAYDSGKIVIATNKLKKLYVNQYNADGTPKLDNAGKNIREWDGKSYERQGFWDTEYLWAIQLLHLYDEQQKRWGIRILRCKANTEYEGEEMWGADCHLPGLLQTVYPHIPLSEWGY